MIFRIVVLYFLHICIPHTLSLSASLFLIEFRMVWFTKSLKFFSSLCLYLCVSLRSAEFWARIDNVVSNAHTLTQHYSSEVTVCMYGGVNVQNGKYPIAIELLECWMFPIQFIYSLACIHSRKKNDIDWYETRFRCVISKLPKNQMPWIKMHWEENPQKNQKSFISPNLG